MLNVHASEEIFEFAWLATPVLLGSIDLRPQFGRSVPGPAWIVKHTTRKSDGIRLPFLQYLFSLPGFIYQAYGDEAITRVAQNPYGDCRETNFFLDALCK